MNLGLFVPQFRDDPQEAIAFSRSIEQVDEFPVDGLFAVDHLWLPGRPGRAALEQFSLLGAVVAATQRIRIGTLVARIGARDTRCLIDNFMELRDAAGDRVIAGLGIGDKSSNPENEALGVPKRCRAERLELLDETASELADGGFTVWLGGRSVGVREVAEHRSVALNLWDPPVEVLDALEKQSLELTWAGLRVMNGGVAGAEDIASVRDLQKRGYTWCVFAPKGRPAVEEVISWIRSLRVS